MLEIQRPVMRAASVLSIHESDSSGQGGVQADARVCAALGCHPLSVVTQVSSRGGLKADQSLAMPVEAVMTQLTALLEGIGADAIKVGMLGSFQSGEAVGRALKGALEGAPGVSVVVDPGLFDKKGRRRADERLDGVFKARFLRLARVVCVNVFEAEALTGRRVSSMDSRRDALRALRDGGAVAAVVVSSQIDRHAVDLVYDGSGFVEMGGDRVATEHHGGAGAALSAGIAAHLARGVGVLGAIEAARALVVEAIVEAARVGPGPSRSGFAPINPMAGLYRRAGLGFASVAVDSVAVDSVAVSMDEQGEQER